MLYETTKEIGPLTIAYRALPEEGIKKEVTLCILEHFRVEEVALCNLEHFRVEVEVSCGSLGALASAHLGDCYARDLATFFTEDDYVEQLTEEALEAALVRLANIEDEVRDTQDAIERLTDRTIRTNQTQDMLLRLFPEV